MNKEQVAKKKFEKSPIQKKKVLINNSEGGAGGGVMLAAVGLFRLFETFLTGTFACIYSRKMCQRPSWANPSTDI